MLKELSGSFTLIRVQTWDLGAPIPQALEDALALEWPTTVGVVATARANPAADHPAPIAAVACLSPAEWLVIGAHSDAANLLPPLFTAIAETPFRATTVADALARIELEGQASRLLLAKGCSLDLHPSRFSAGRCARTRLAGMPIVLWCLHESAFQCIVASSYREYLIAWLADASLEREMTLS